MAHSMISQSKAFQDNAFSDLQALKKAVSEAEAQFGPDDDRTRELKERLKAQYAHYLYTLG